MTIIFLDFDGVINTIQIQRKENSTLSQYKPIIYNSSDKKVSNTQAVLLLSKLCEENNANIVITSSWRLGSTTKELAQILYNSGLSHNVKIIGCTPVIDMWREKEIEAWLNKHSECSSFIIIDDDIHDLTQYSNNLVHTNCYDGFTFSKYLEARELLKKS